MKTAEEIIKEGNEGYSLREVIDNLTDDQILNCFKEYAEQAIDECSRSAKTKWDFGHKHIESAYVDKESILIVKTKLK